jgi:hypothetical protein
VPRTRQDSGTDACHNDLNNGLAPPRTLSVSAGRRVFEYTNRLPVPGWHFANVDDNRQQYPCKAGISVRSADLKKGGSNLPPGQRFAGCHCFKPVRYSVTTSVELRHADQEWPPCKPLAVCDPKYSASSLRTDGVRARAGGKGEG